jgi:hypothetical protein
MERFGLRENARTGEWYVVENVTTGRPDVPRLVYRKGDRSYAENAVEALNYVWGLQTAQGVPVPRRFEAQLGGGSPVAGQGSLQGLYAQASK